MSLTALRIRIHRKGDAVWPWVKDAIVGAGFIIFVISSYWLIDLVAAAFQAVDW